MRSGYEGRKSNSVNISTVDDAKKSCELEFGSYCLWSIEHKEVMKDSLVKRLKDQLFVARAYYPSIAKIHGKEQFSRELKENIQEHERMLSEAISDVDLPPLVIDKIQKMDETIRRAKLCTVDCNNINKKFRQLLDLTEDEAYFHRKQSAFLYHLGVQTIPKNHHCLSMRLTVELFKSQSLESDLDNPKFHSPSFMHFVIFSKNILAASVVINSTIMSSEVLEFDTCILGRVDVQRSGAFLVSVSCHMAVVVADKVASIFGYVWVSFRVDCYAHATCQRQKQTR